MILLQTYQKEALCQQPSAEAFKEWKRTYSLMRLPLIWLITNSGKHCCYWQLLLLMKLQKCCQYYFFKNSYILSLSIWPWRWAKKYWKLRLLWHSIVNGLFRHYSNNKSVYNSWKLMLHSPVAHSIATDKEIVNQITPSASFKIQLFLLQQTSDVS